MWVWSPLWHLGMATDVNSRIVRSPPHSVLSPGHGYGMVKYNILSSQWIVFAKFLWDYSYKSTSQGHPVWDKSMQPTAGKQRYFLGKSIERSFSETLIFITLALLN